MKDKDSVPASFRTPFTLIRRLSEDVERMFEDVGFRVPFAFTTPGDRFDWLPAVEVVERDNNLFVRAELPGLSKKDVKIEIAEGVLTIQGERKQEKQETKEGVIRSELSYGTFYRRLPLPDGVNSDAAKATFQNGILEIQMPVVAKKPASGRQLEIEEPEKQLVGV